MKADELNELLKKHTDDNVLKLHDYMQNELKLSVHLAIATELHSVMSLVHTLNPLIAGPMIRNLEPMLALFLEVLKDKDPA